MFDRGRPIPLGVLRACAAETLGYGRPDDESLIKWRDAEWAAKYSDDQPRDKDGRFAGGADEGSKNVARELGASVDEDEDAEAQTHAAANPKKPKPDVGADQGSRNAAREVAQAMDDDDAQEEAIRRAGGSRA